MTNTFKFTESGVTRAPVPSAGRAFYNDTDSPLAMSVRSTGSRSYYVLATIAGRSKRITLGRVGTLKLAMARRAAEAARSQAASGADPIAEKRAAKAATDLTLRAALKDYLAKRRVKQGKHALKDSTKDDYEAKLSLVFGKHMDKPVTLVTEALVRKLNQPRAAYATGLRVAHAVFAWLMQVHPEIVKSNPVAILTRTRERFTAKRITTHIGADRLADFIDAIPEGERGALVAFLLFTGARIGETLALQWADVDLAGCTFKLFDTKNRSDVLLPLPATVAARLRTMTPSEGCVFESIVGEYARGVFEDMNFTGSDGERISAHDLRRTFGTVAESMELSSLTIKRLLNHAAQEHDVTSGYVARDIERLRRASTIIEQEILRLAKRPALASVKRELHAQAA